MNKKLIALMIVPIMLTLSGAMAYSAFSGSVTTNVTATAGTLTYSIGTEVVDYYSMNTNISVSGGVGSDTSVVYLLGNTVTGQELLAPVPVSGGSGVPIIYYLNVSNLAPGNWVHVEITLTNTGTVGLIFARPALETSIVKITPTAYPPDLNLSNVTGVAGSTTISQHVFEYQYALSGISSLSATDSTYLAFTNYGANTGVNYAPLSGYAYAFGKFTSFPVGHSVDKDKSVDFSFYIGLSNGAKNGYQESSVSIPLLINVMSDP